jgi:antitoxin CptB
MSGQNTSTENNSSIASKQISPVNKARLKWACRRGMLELDILFIPFVEEAYDALSLEQQYIFERLLTEQDPDLFAWFMGHKVCEDKELNAMVQLILNRVKV